MPVFSVIMACYNAELYVSKAIASVVNQTFSDWELIVVDDASQDNSLQYIKMAAESEPRIRYISSNINMGAAAARNVAINVSKGKWLAILDADDIFLPQKLENQFEVIKNCGSSLVLVGAGCYHIDSNGFRLKEHNYPNGSDVLKKNLLTFRNFPPHSSLIYRKDVFLAVGGFNLLFARSEDFELWLKLSSVGEFYALPFPLIEYRLHLNNISGSMCQKNFNQTVYGFAAAVCQMLNNRGFPDPRKSNDPNLFDDFLDFVSQSISNSNYYVFTEWKIDLKNDLQRATNIHKKIKVMLIGMVRSPLSIVRLALERFVGNRLPYTIFKLWIKHKNLIN